MVNGVQARTNLLGLRASPVITGPCSTVTTTSSPPLPSAPQKSESTTSVVLAAETVAVTEEVEHDGLGWPLESIGVATTLYSPGLTTKKAAPVVVGSATSVVMARLSISFGPAQTSMRTAASSGDAWARKRTPIEPEDAGRPSGSGACPQATAAMLSAKRAPFARRVMDV